MAQTCCPLRHSRREGQKKAELNQTLNLATEREAERKGVRGMYVVESTVDVWMVSHKHCLEKNPTTCSPLYAH